MPKRLVIDGVTNIYTYSADGRKLRVVQGSDIRDYAGSFIYENSSLRRILIEGGYIENGVVHFYFNDHLGNVRAVVDASGTTVQKNDYYPFGLPMAEVSDNEQNKQPYKYNGKEFERNKGLNLYDYGARQMDPGIGRFTTIDPLAEKYYGISPYAYCANNPMRFVDPDGRAFGGPGGPVSLYRYIGMNPKQAQNVGNTVLKMTSLDDVVVLGSALMGPFTDSHPVHIDGSPASGDDVQYAKSSLLLPVSGKAVKEAGKVVDAATSTVNATRTTSKTVSPKVQKVIDSLNEIQQEGGKVQSNRLKLNQELNMTI